MKVVDSMENDCFQLVRNRKKKDMLRNEISVGVIGERLSFRVKVAMENVEALENVIEDEPHFFMEIVDNDIQVVVAKVEEEVPWQEEAGWLAKLSIVSNEGLGGGRFVVRGGGREVIGSGVDLGVKSSSGEILDETMGERGGDMMRLSGGPVEFDGKRLSLKFKIWVVMLMYYSTGSAGSMCSMEPSFSNEGNWLLQNCH
uniref:Uncharacterized protein n=1 Tax=Tanacetum cinerariifolium TaxID=118510 RepID=A0A6L2LKT0_TANCI|nr:hypothetical protein [Tanacetum cinerariifolium]